MTFDEALAVQKTFKHPKPWMYVHKLWFVRAASGDDFATYELREDPRLRLTRTTTPIGTFWTASWQVTEERRVECKDTSAMGAIIMVKIALKESIKRMNELFRSAALAARNKNNAGVSEHTTDDVLPSDNE